MNRSYINTASFAAFISNKAKLLLTVLLLVFAFYGNVNAQCSITTSTSASTLNSSNICATFSGCTIITVGDGSTMTLTVNEDLDFSCLGPIQLVIKNAATIFFNPSYRLILNAGSNIVIEPGGVLAEDPPCSASQRIYIGNEIISSCNGGAGADYSFSGLVANGGYSSITASASPSSICNSGSSTITATANPTSGATYKWYTVASGGTPVYTGNPFSTGTISTSRTYYVEASYSSPTYSTIRKAVTVTVTNAPIPTIGTITQPTCTLQTGSVNLSGLPASGTINQTGAVVASYPITGTSMTISGLASGTYTYTVSNGSCTSAASSNVAINTTTKTWNGSTWSPSAPTINDNIIINGNYTLSSDLEVCSCQVNATGYVDVNSDITLTITNDLKVVSGGVILFKDKSSLLQINNNIPPNSGNIKYERKILSSTRNTDYTYWSSPVAGMNLEDFSPYTMDGMFYTYNSSTGNWQQEDPSTTNMTAGIGYVIRGPESQIGGIPTPSSRYNNTFIGLPNNGDVTVPVTFTNPLNLASDNPDFGVSYLLGNPYPSALDAEKFLDNNAGVIGGTLYFWTHITQIGIGVSDPGTGLYAYSGNDYAAYNSVGGVSVGSGTGSTSGSAPPSGKIAAGQGFFATAIATGNVKFNNSMRVVGNNSQFFKSRNPKTITKNAIEKNRIWLNLTNTQGAFKQTLVGYITDATNEYDDRFDGESFDGNEFVDFYSVNQDKNLTIQGRALPFDENDEVPLGYRTTINGAFTINIDQVDGSLTNQAVYIEDKLTNTITDLKSGNYTFNTVAGTFDDRFVLKYKDNSTAKTLATANFDAQANKVLVSIKNKQIKINSNSETIDKVMIYDISGKLIYKKEKANTQEVIISTLTAKNQVLIVKTTLQNGKTVTDKIVN